MAHSHNGYSVRQWVWRNGSISKSRHTQKIVLDTSLLDTQHYKVLI